MSRRYEFVCEQNEETGELGYRPVWVSFAHPLSGMAVAHDCLEHFPKDDSSTEAELMALGAGIWLRGVGNYYHRKGCSCTEAASHVASDFPTLFFYHEHQHGGRRLTYCDFWPNEKELRNECRKAVCEGASLLWMHEYRFSDWDKEQSARWLSFGYRRAQKRYRNSDPSMLTEMFIEIEEHVDAILRSAEVGDRLVVRTDVSRYSTRFATRTHGMGAWEFVDVL